MSDHGGLKGARRSDSKSFRVFQGPGHCVSAGGGSTDTLTSSPSLAPATQGDPGGADGMGRRDYGSNGDPEPFDGCSTYLVSAS